MNDLDKDLEAAVERDLDASGIPLSPSRQERLRVLKRAEGNPAMDQLHVAIDGLLKIEQELYQFSTELVGPFKVDEADKPQPSSEGPLIPRLRSDSELIARLCIRMHRLIQEVRSRL